MIDIKQLNQPKEITINTQSGTAKKYILTKMPYYCEGSREICTQFFKTGLAPSHYKANEETSLKMMKYIGVPMDGGNVLMLETPQLANNHIPDFMAAVQLEKEMIEYNVGFFPQGTISNFSTQLIRMSQPFLLEISKLLQGLSSPKAKRRSKS